MSCVAFGKKAEVAEKYLKQGRQVAIAGRLQTGSYTNKDGVKVYTTDVLVEEIQFCGTNSQNGQQSEQQRQTSSKNSNQSNPLDIPDGIDEELPFN